MSAVYYPTTRCIVPASDARRHGLKRHAARPEPRASRGAARAAGAAACVGSGSVGIAAASARAASGSRRTPASLRTVSGPDPPHRWAARGGTALSARTGDAGCRRSFFIVYNRASAARRRS